MQRKRQNESYYQYRASCQIRKEDGSEEIKNYELETDILYGDMHLWNRLHHFRQSQNMLFDLVGQDPGIVKCKILEEDLVLVPRFTYGMDYVYRKKGVNVGKLLLIIEMILLLILNMTRASRDGERDFLKGNAPTAVHTDVGAFLDFHDQD